MFSDTTTEIMIVFLIIYGAVCLGIGFGLGAWIF